MRARISARIMEADPQALARAGVRAGDNDLSVYVRDRAPFVRFPGRAYVLPRGGCRPAGRDGEP